MNTHEIPETNILEISYDSLKNDLRNVVNRIKLFTNLEFSSMLEDIINKQAGDQPSYKRKHKNLSLEELNLTEDKIRTDFDFVFKRYGFK